MTDEGDIRALEDQRYQAMVDGDVATLETIFAPSLTYTHSNGSVDTKRTFLEAIASERFRYRAARRLEEHVQLYDAAAIVSGHVQLDVTIGGDTERTVDARFTAVWVHHEGTWKFAAWQSTPRPA
jgi:uncharacterized protein (TIGR02246 family)